MTTANEQVYIGLDGPDGVILQVSMAAYEEYYRALGYKVIGPAIPYLPPPKNLQRNEQY